MREMHSQLLSRMIQKRQGRSDTQQGIPGYDGNQQAYSAQSRQAGMSRQHYKHTIHFITFI